MEENQVHIPDGWVSDDLGNLIKERRKSPLKVSDAANFGEYPFFTSGEAVLQHTNKLLDGENIFLATGGVANIKYYEGDAAYSTDTYTITTKDDIDTEYLYFDLLNILYYINANYFQGSGLKHLQKKDLKKHQILYPKSKTEQTQIASILSKVDEAITQTEQLIAKYTRIKTGLMQDLLTKGIDEHGNIRSEETHEFKDSPMGRIPKEWEYQTLENMLDNVPNNMRSGPFGSSLTKSEWVETGIPYLGIDNVFREQFIDSYKRFVTHKKFTQLERYAVRPKDVMITIMGTVGRSCVVPDTIGNALSSKHVWTMTFNQKKYIPELVSYQLNYSPWILRAFNEESQGGIMSSINSKILKRLVFPTPTITEQIHILEKMQQSNSHLAALEYSNDKLQSLKTGLMQDLLSGKVRINHLIKETMKT